IQGTTLGNVIGGHIPRRYGSLQYVFVIASALACVGMALTMSLYGERRLGGPSAKVWNSA
uniref:hypothetical protein n=1 Tax=Pseudomonas viridiflava TaxID=33069 RepID=UPI0019D0A9DB